MQFHVPQFIEREIKIVGPLTLKQFGFIASGFFACIGLYIVLFQKSFFLFFMSCSFTIGASLALAFGNVYGRPLTTAIANFLTYIISPKSYLWQRKAVSPKLISVQEKEKKQEKELQKKKDKKDSRKS